MDKHIPETINYKLYQQDLNFKHAKNVIKYVDEAQNFYNGNQYPNENFNNMIRVTMNICSLCAKVKASKVCGTPIYLTFTADNDTTDCTALRRFDEYNCSKLHMDESNYHSALNGFVNGTEILFTRWDSDDTTYKGIYKGGLQEEHIDIRNFAVANYAVLDIQNQEWLMFWEDYPIGALRDLCEGTEQEIKEKKELLGRESMTANSDDYKDQELINSKLAKMFTRFFRVNGEVYFMCSTQYVDLFAYPHPLSRKAGQSIIKKVVDEYKKKMKENPDDDPTTANEKEIEDYAIDYQDIAINITSNEIYTDDEYKKTKEKFYLYPFAIFRPTLTNRFFYGTSDIKQLIPIQKAINFCYSMVLKCVENNAYNKILVKPEALKDQVISNEPGQVLVDYSGFNNTWGIKPLESQSTPNGVMEFATAIIKTSREIYGFSDVMDGTVTNKDMSGYMLQQMIQQSNTSIEQQQKLFWLFNEEKAAIRLMYYKHYVDKAKYTYEISDAEFSGQEQAQNMLKMGMANGRKLESMPNVAPEEIQKLVNRPLHKKKVGNIANEDIYGVNFDIAIKSMQGLSESKLVEQQFFDTLLLNGGINNMNPDILQMYLEASPNVSERTKTSLKQIVENLKHSENQMLKDQLNEMMQKGQQLLAYAKQLESANGYQGNYIKNLESEFSTKINNQNKIIGGLSKSLDQYRATPESEGEVKSNNSRGISGGTTKAVA